MKSFVLMSVVAASLAIGGPAAARAQGSAQPAPWTSYGTSLFATGPDIWVRFFGADAGYTSSLFFICNMAETCQQFLFQNNNGVPSTREIKINHTFAAGEEMIFKIMVASTQDTWFTGAANRNSDGLAHFASQNIWRTTDKATYTVLGGFEDMRGGGDKDYNDLMFEFSNVAVTATPEPASIALMATGLVGVGAMVRRRRRSSKP